DDSSAQGSKRSRIESLFVPLDKKDLAPATSLVAPRVFSSTLCKDAASDSSCLPSAAASPLCALPATRSVSCLQEDTSPLSDSPGQIKEVSEPTTRVSTFDVGNFAGKGRPDDFTLSQLLENNWQAPKGYVYPSSQHKKKGKVENRFVREEHLSKYPWLVVSDVKRGLFCKYCPFFVVGSVGGYQRNVPLNDLVTRPLTSFAKLLGKDGVLELHNSNKYHRDAVEAGKEFLACHNSPTKDVANQLETKRLEKIAENSGRIGRIIDCIVFLGRQNIPLRGHRDFGALSLPEHDEASSPVNQGNFRELLRFLVQSGDKALQNHLKASSSRATYISSRTQNELIGCCGDEVLAQIQKNLMRAEYYSIIFDETTDISHMSQMSLVFRYVQKSQDGTHAIREDFAKFVDCHASIFAGYSQNDDEGRNPAYEPSLTGEVLGKIVKKEIKSMGLLPTNCVGIGTDGCSLMISETCGAIHEIKKEAVNAVRCPCFSHALNLSLSKSSSIQSVRNFMGIITATVSFFTSSSKRNAVLRRVLKEQLQGLCETRWVEGHSAVLEFRSSLADILEALEIVANWKNQTPSAAKASTLIAGLRTSNWLCWSQ
ncbi:unnamed protein product, partial [Ixodes pacificus]